MKELRRKLGAATHGSRAKKYKFSGHQTFVFRHGWLEKGARAVDECPTALLQEDALVRLALIPTGPRPLT